LNARRGRAPRSGTVPGVRLPGITPAGTHAHAVAFGAIESVPVRGRDDICGRRGGPESGVQRHDGDLRAEDASVESRVQRCGTLATSDVVTAPVDRMPNANDPPFPENVPSHAVAAAWTPTLNVMLGSIDAVTADWSLA